MEFVHKKQQYKLYLQRSYFILHLKTAISLVKWALYASLTYAQNHLWRMVAVAEGV